MEDKLNKTLIDSLSGYINPKTKKPIHNPKKMKSRKNEKAKEEQIEKDDSSNSTRTAPRNVPPGTDIWRPARPLHKEEE